MKLVLDTNVLVSGLLCPYGAPGEIVEMVASGALELCYDARIFSEYRNVLLRPKFRFDQVHIDYLLDQIKAGGHVVAVMPLSKSLPHVDDEAFLEVAVAAKAKYLCTGNIKHYPRDRRHGVVVVSPPDLLRILQNIS